MSPVSNTPAPARAPVSIEFPSNGEIRVRRLVSRSAPRPITKYPSVRLGRSVHCESSLEAEFAELLDACVAVSRFCEQPAIIHYQMDGVPHRHIPDFLASTKHRKAFIEIKFERDVTPDVMARTEFLQRALKNKGYEYHLLTERMIRRDAYLENARFLLKRGRMPLPRQRELELFSQVYAAKSVSFSSLTAGEGMAHVSRMILNGVLSVSMDVPIRPDTPVTVANKEEGQPWVWALFN